MDLLRGHDPAHAVLLAVLSLLPVECLAATELVRDPDFRQLSGDRPVLWGVNTFKTQAAISVKTDADGKRWISLRNETIDACSDIATYGSGLSLPKGTMVRFSGWYRTENLVFGQQPLFYGTVGFNAHKGGDRFGMGTGALKPAKEWTRFEQTVSLKKDVQSFELVMLFFRCKGELTLRHISLEVITPQDSLVLFSLKKKPPAIDGNLEDECWKGAQMATGFMPLGKMEPVTADTVVMSCYDDANLYVAARMKEPNLAAISVHPRIPSNGDCLELFLDPAGSGRSYFHLIVDAQGKCYTGVNDGTEKPAALKVNARSGRCTEGWTVELAIPFASLGTARPADNARWSFNAGRERYAVKPQENTSWAALGAFTQRERFGKLAFYSRHEVVADIEYWNASDRDPLMRRPVVSGCEIAAAFAGVRRLPTLWSYDPFGAPREKHAAWKCRGLSEKASQEYPEFYQAAMGINGLLVNKAKADDALGNLRRQIFWYSSSATAQSGKPAVDVAPLQANLERDSAALDTAINDLYQTYGKAFDDGWNKAQLAGIDARIAGVSAQITELQQRTADAAARLRNETAKSHPWTCRSLEIPQAERLPNAGGTPSRFAFSSYGYKGDDGPFSLLGTFESVTLGWPSAIPKQPSPGVYVYEYLDRFFSGPKQPGEIARGHLQVTFGLADYFVPLSPTLEKEAKTDPDILLISQDGLTGKKLLDWGAALNLHSAGNPNNPKLLAYTEDYLKSLAAHVAATGKMDFFLTAWESKNSFHVTATKGESAPRSLGFNPSGKQAFRDYLKERYASLDDLNRRWGTAYASFSAIEPPADKHLAPPRKPSGLSFEFERWSRVNHARYMANLRTYLKKGAPGIPVMTDDSTMLAEMNGYLMFRENAADIYSFHMNPSWEEALWTYLASMRRRFGKELGYYENYWQMFTSAHLQNEQLAQRDVRKLFFSLLTHDIRFTTWWLGYMSHATDYVVAYGGGQLGMDYDQTILRWSTAELAPMFARCRAVERALVESVPETPKTAIVQPCTTIYRLASLGKTCLDSPAIQEMLAAHYRLLSPANYPHDYLPEEMVLDRKASLEEYRVLVLPYAPFMTESFSRQLTEWVQRGGTLIAVGPFAVQDECGHLLPADASLFRKLFPEVRKQGDGDWDYGPAPGREPAMAAKPSRKGTVVYLNRPLDVYQRNPALLEPLAKLLTEVAHRTAFAPAADLEIAVRDTPGGDRYLCLCNRNVATPVETTVTVRGKYRQALDVQIPGWFPVPVQVNKDQTLVKVRLDPGDSTLILLTAGESASTSTDRR